MSKEYVLAFLFNDELSKVLLIKKKRPEWQAGMYNGIGGKIEKDEFVIKACQREIFEETGLSDISLVLLGEMIERSDLTNINWRVYIYTGICDIEQAKSMTDEKIEIIDLSNIDNLLEQALLIDNLKWLIELSRYQLITNRLQYVEINYAS